jgi:hypothetical protein
MPPAEYSRRSFLTRTKREATPISPPPEAATGPGADGVGDAIVKAVQRFVAERPQFDDITLFCLGRC